MSRGHKADPTPQPASRWEAVIGLEVHVQLRTRSKIFSPAATEYGAPPNTQACALSIALPGTLPVMNWAAVQLAVKFGLSINATINQHSIFARKNYFYPDLPKGYQISQFAEPIVGAGSLTIMVEAKPKIIGITRAHLEEDAGKSLHEAITARSGIDLNRAGTPLLEIVSEPDLRSAGEAVTYLKKLHALVTYLDLCDGNMQEGSFRCDANVSIRAAGARALGTRAELKNINSFRFVEKAINYEIARQIEVLEAGEKVVQETRLYDADHDTTRAMRGKEEAHDYRYFPDPDLPALVLDDDFIAQIRADLPELPDARQARFESQYQLATAEAATLLSDHATADYFEAVCHQTAATPKIVANWVSGEVMVALQREGLPMADTPIDSQRLATLLDRLADQTISATIAKQVFAELWRSDQTADQIIAAKGLQQISDSGELTAIVGAVLADNPTPVAQYRAGRTKVFGFLVGQVMQRSAGKANPKQASTLLREHLTASTE